ncbi:TetR/AcrR family transcriptional regulator [Gloeobacter kilaueensis]|uniref:TetR family transcriptional regulator n=1 Tax=Gloeobacter kilaueensis (strain ATCC BAA-2537 / CCAP 1431/1 / ULC 316 / JS1) TaxID=1183438 RepID=U5QNB3_GLOK1|nr:TetR/AcrR family transcriptional regulator [Gloeobacter kilaueensis]AGY59170.1 TetR family transcriptional regulator [Gloeobacter kilaueensis JS1]
MRNLEGETEHTLRRVPRQRRGHERVARILDAAARVFAEVGYEAATTHQIAERAGTAVGSLYQYFPDKRAIFAALEERHQQQVEAFHTRLESPEIAQLPLEQMIARMVQMSVRFFEDPAPRVMFLLYYSSPQLFERFDEDFIRQLVQRAGALLRARNPALEAKKVDVVAETFIQSFNHLLLVALRNPPERGAQLVQELQNLLIAYLRPYDQMPAADEPAASGLSERQRLALRWAAQQGELTIQRFEALCPGCSRRSLQRDLSHLVRSGWLQVSGQTNQRTYRPSIRQTRDNL